MPNYEAVVVGGGVAGASILYSLARKGFHRTVLLDRGRFASGSTGRSAAMIRVFHQSAALADLASESLPHYLKFEEEVGLPCGFQATGSLYFEPTSKLGEVHRSVQRLRRKGHRLEILDKKIGENRFPQIAWPERTFAIYEPDAGFADPVVTTRSWIERAESLGAESRESCGVREIIRHEGRVLGVSTDQGEFRAPVVIIAAGAWSKELLAPLGVEVPLNYRSIQLNRFRGQKPKGLHPIFFDYGSRSYGRPDGESASLVGCASSANQTESAQESVGDPLETRRARKLAARTLRGITKSRMTGSIRVREAYTTDHQGLVGEVAGHVGLVVAAGFSGTGFKVAPAIGRRVVALAQRRLR